MSQPESESLFSPLDDPLFLSPTDQPGLKLSETLFDGSNFRHWQREIIQALLSKNKIGFISGECLLPEKTDKRYNAWIRCDIFVSRWIKNSMIKTLQDNFQYTQSSKHLWSELVERFGQLNVLELYELKKELANVKQENASLIDYYSKIKGLWENIDHMDPVPQCICGIMAKCSCNLLKRLVERETQSKLIQLLMGLHAGYEQVQSSLLSMEPLPPINKALGVLQKIERQKSINDSTGSAGVENVAYAAKKRFNGPKTAEDNKNKRSKDNFGNATVVGQFDNPPCAKCGKTNHKTADCFQLQTCLFCDIKGHIIEHCYKFKAWKAKQAKKNGNSAEIVAPAPPPSKTANNAEVSHDQDAEYAAVYGSVPSFPAQYGNPFYPTSYGYINPVGSIPAPQIPTATADTPVGSQVSPDLVQGIVDSVMNKVLQALSERASSSNSDIPASQSFSHFAGIPLTHSYANYGSTSHTDWVIDTGASDHITLDISLMHNVVVLSHPLSVALPDGTLKPVYKTGTVYLTSEITLFDVLLIPDFQANLLSVGKLITRSKLTVTFFNNACFFQDPSSKTNVACGKRCGDLYRLRVFTNTRSCNKASSVHSVNQINVALLHSRLGHSSIEKLKHVHPATMKNINKMFCETCVFAKHHSLPFNRSTSHATKCFDLVHMDLWGPYRQPDRTGAQSFLTILDDYTRCTWTFLEQQKTQVPNLIISFINMIETQFSAKIKIIRSDNGTEFFQVHCSDYFASKGIVHQRSIKGHPQQNGRVERKHRHLLETARALRFHAKLPIRFWGDCLLTATYLINKMPSSVLNWQTPHELLFNTNPRYDELRVFGSLCYATMPPTARDKFMPKARRCIFLGYPPNQKVLEPVSSS
ncbi:uncharacterized protein LOC141641385 [Silene latifolia]|uniref:uncharacterized protein LOC141641385 n=1 Tax=Silene latifolia TaxID=37657 RepID=UPI003D77184D